MVKAVIFDLDGLLVNTEITWYMVFKDILESFGHTFTLKEYVEGYSGKTIAQNTNTIREKYHLPFDQETGVKKLISREQEYIQKGVDLKPGARELLEYLKENDYRIVLGSSSLKKRAVAILDGHDAVRYFDDMACGNEVERGKPYPDIFLLASDKAGVKPEECLVLEDSEAGIQAAHTAHIPVICVPDLKKPREQYGAMTEAVLPSLIDVIEYLKTQNSNAKYEKEE